MTKYNNELNELRASQLGDDSMEAHQESFDFLGYEEEVEMSFEDEDEEFWQDMVGAYALALEDSELDESEFLVRPNGSRVRHLVG